MRVFFNIYNQLFGGIKYEIQINNLSLDGIGNYPASDDFMLEISSPP
jgi:hypothetical protein